MALRLFSPIFKFCCLSCWDWRAPALATVLYCICRTKCRPWLAMSGCENLCCFCLEALEICRKDMFSDDDADDADIDIDELFELELFAVILICFSFWTFVFFALISCDLFCCLSAFPGRKLMWKSSNRESNYKCHILLNWSWLLISGIKNVD